MSSFVRKSSAAVGFERRIRVAEMSQTMAITPSVLPLPSRPPPHPESQLRKTKIYVRRRSRRSGAGWCGTPLSPPPNNPYPLQLVLPFAQVLGFVGKTKKAALVNFLCDLSSHCRHRFFFFFKQNPPKEWTSPTDRFEICRVNE